MKENFFTVVLFALYENTYFFGKFLFLRKIKFDSWKEWKGSKLQSQFTMYVY